MTRAQRLLAIAAVLVAALGVLVAGGSTFAAQEENATFSGSDSISSVDLESDAGRVEVVVAPAGEIKILRTSRYVLDAPDLREVVVDGVLRLTARCPRPVAVACDVRFRLELPPAVALRVRGGRATVSVRGVAGPVDVQTKAGAISLEGTSGPVTARTAAGSIDGVDLAPPFIDASTAAGSIRLSLTKPPGRVDLATRAGGIDLVLPPDRYRVEAESGAGKVDVGVVDDDTSSYTVRARTDAGSIRIRPA